jgi:hypothetical protein
MADKTFIPASIKEHRFNNGNKVLNVAVKVDEMAKYCNEEGWVNVTIARRRNISEKGQTHYMTLNTWKPNKKTEQDEQKDSPIQEEEINTEDIPF